MPKLNLQLFLGVLYLIRGCRPPEDFLLCHDLFGRWEHKLIGADTHLAFLQGVNYGVHGRVGFVL